MHNPFQVRFTTIALAAVALAATPVIAQSVARSQSSAQGQSGASSASGGRMTVVSRESMDGDEGGQSSIEVRIDNGKVTVKRNGQVVPDAQIRHGDDGRIVILDENGNQLQAVDLFVAGDQQGQAFAGGGLRGFKFRTGDGQNNPLGMGGAVALDDGPAPTVMIGIHMGEPGPALEKHLGLEPGKSLMITGVLEGLPAFEAGLAEYDVILAIDGNPVGASDSIRQAIAGKQAGDAVTLRVIQAGKQKDVKVTLQAFDAERMSAAKLLGTDANGISGWMNMPKGDEFNIDLGQIDLPDWRGRILVAPQLDQLKEQWSQIQPQLENLQPRIAELQPMIERYIHDALKQHQAAPDAAPQQHGSNPDVESQLDRLDQRMAQLEKMLQQLVERQPKP